MKMIRNQGHGAGKSLTLSLGGETVLDFSFIPAGSFRMGSPVAEEGHEDSEAPQRLVTFSRDFWLSSAPVTAEQWNALMGLPPEAPPDGAQPRTHVSWEDAQRFVVRLSAVFPGQSFRLPTEAEWEYACRAGTTGCYSNGETEADLAQIAWYAGNSGGTTHPVGMKEKNAWGLYDMHGNVFEWCLDWDGPYPCEEQRDPTGPPDGTKRILRGGCFKCPPLYCRAANRYSAPPDRRAPNFGFRLAAVP